MPTVRNVATIWIGSLVGIITAAAFLNLTPPLFSQFLDGSLTFVAFAVGSAAGVALVRHAHSTPVETAPTAELVREALLVR